jgi:hypothetical protein
MTREQTISAFQRNHLSQLSVFFFAILCSFVLTIADAALLQSFFGGKDGRMMAHPEGFR